MHYLGGKNRTCRFIAPIIQKALQKYPNSTSMYLEPFCGACNVLAKVRAQIRLASDIHEDLILMWQALQHGNLSMPQCISHEMYKSFMKQPPSALRGFVGFACGYGGQFYGTFARNKRGQNALNSSRDYLHRARSSVLDKVPHLIGVSFHHCDYKQWFPQNMVIYCDPPYENTAGYEETPDFDHKEFWDVMRAWSRNNTVFISEQNAPPDFTTVWQMSIRRIVASKVSTRAFVTEKLFQYKQSGVSN